MMEDKERNSAWLKKGATLSDKSVRKEFRLTQEEATFYKHRLIYKNI
jgi:hypothetical protein